MQILATVHCFFQYSVPFSLLCLYLASFHSSHLQSYCQDVCSEQDCQKANDGRLIEVEFECFDCTLRYSSIDSFCYNEYIDACMDNASCSLFSEKYAQCIDLIEEEQTDTSE